MFKPALLLLTLAVALGGCAAPATTVTEIPAWVDKPPANDTGDLSFVGSAAGPTEAKARRRAVADAMHEAATFCGATVKGEFHSEEREQDGKSSYSVSQAIDIGGDKVTLRKFTRQELVIRPSKHKAGFQAYVLMRWPRSEYELVQKRRAKRSFNQSVRALELFLQAEEAENERYAARAGQALNEAQAILRAIHNTTPIAHPKYRDTQVLWDATEAMRGRLDKLTQDRSGVVAIGVRCEDNDQPARCPPGWASAARAAVGRTGFELVAAPMSEQLTAAVLRGEQVKSDRALRRAGYLVAIGVDVRDAGQNNGYRFATCGASMGIFDLSSQRTVATGRVDPARGAQPDLPAAARRACEDIKPEVLAWLQDDLGGLRPDAR